MKVGSIQSQIELVLNELPVSFLYVQLALRKQSFVAVQQAPVLRNYL
ncbi:hypothetical protein [Bacillus rhizoplanae]